jgi:hypothetical protein
VSRPTARQWIEVCVLIAASAASLEGQAPVSPPVPIQAQGRPAVPAGAAVAAPDPAAVERADQILIASRLALGGDRLAAVTSLIATGQTRRVRGNNLVPIEFEMSLEWPDKYVRRDESPAEESAPTSTGFNGDELIQVPPPIAPPARAGGPPAPSAEQLAAQQRSRVVSLKQDFARFALGLFPGSFDTYPLTFAFAAVAEAPQGKADVLDVRGAGGFTLRLLISSETRLPVMVSWMLPPTSVVITTPGQPPPASIAPGAVVVAGPAPPAVTASDAEKAAHTEAVAALRKKAQATPVEHRIYFADYRDVDGVRLPFRLRRSIGADTTEETTFDRFRLNTRIPAQRFAPVR